MQVTVDEENIHMNGFYVELILKLDIIATWRADAAQTRRAIRLQLVARKRHFHITLLCRLYKVKSLNRTTSQVQFKGV